MKQIDSQGKLAWDILSHVPVKYAKRALKKSEYNLEPSLANSVCVAYVNDDGIGWPLVAALGYKSAGVYKTLYGNSYGCKYGEKIDVLTLLAACKAKEFLAKQKKSFKHLADKKIWSELVVAYGHSLVYLNNEQVKAAFKLAVKRNIKESMSDRIKAVNWHNDKV